MSSDVGNPTTPPRTLGQLPFDVLHDVFEFLEWPAVRTGPARASRRLREAAHAEAFFFRLVRRDVVFAPARKPAAAIAEASPAADDANVAHRPQPPTMRKTYARWGSTTTHAIIAPSSCDFRCPPCVAQPPADPCPQTRKSIAPVESEQTPVGAPTSARAVKLQLKYDTEPMAIPVTVRSVSALGAVSPALVNSFARMCRRVVSLETVEDVIFFDPVAVSLRFNASPPTAPFGPDVRRWVLRELLAGPFAAALQSAFFTAAMGVGAADGVLVQIGVVTNAKLRDPFDLSANCRVRSDPSRRQGPAMRPPPPEFYMQGIPWRAARTHAELIGILDDAGAACAKAMARDPDLRMYGTTWFLRIVAPGGGARADRAPYPDGDGAAEPTSERPWTPEQLAGTLPPPLAVRGFLNIGYHAQFATYGGVGGGLGTWAREERKEVSTLIKCLQGRFAAKEPKLHPVRDAMSTQFHASAIRARTGALIVAVLPERGVRDIRRLSPIMQAMDAWVPRDPPAR
jgi:hypothetical protein